jgi:hypothetical protein
MRIHIAAILAVSALNAACAATDDVTVDQEPDPQSTPFQSTPAEPFNPVEATCTSPVQPSDARVGERQAITGIVTGTSTVEDARGSAVVLEMTREGGDTPFAVAIPQDAVTNFPEPPADTYDGSQICVRGVVQDFMGVPTIFVTLPNEIEVADQ